MNGVIVSVLTISAILTLALLVVLAILSFFDPDFEMANNSPGVVSVVAAWPTGEKELGDIRPLSSSKFRAGDEGAMRCELKYSGGKVVKSEARYFTRGTKVIATITSDGVLVRHDFAT